MATFNTLPAVSFLENLPDAVISGATTTVEVSVTFDNKVVVNRLKLTPDARGTIVVRLKDMIRRLASIAEIDRAFSSLPILRVSAYLSSTPTTRTVFIVPGGTAAAIDDQAGWLAQNFLTCQPQIIETTPTQPQYLAMVAMEGMSVRSRLYTVEGQSFVKTIAVFGRDYYYEQFRTDFYTLWDELCRSEGVTPLCYDVFGEGIHPQRYVLRPERYNDVCFLFENTLGGLDSIMISGQQSYQPEGDVTSFRNIEAEREIYNDFTSGWEANTGIFETEAAARQFQDFLKSTKRWVMHEGVAKRIVVAEHKVKHVRGDANSYTFKYRLSEKNERRNVERGELPAFGPPPNLTYRVDGATPQSVTVQVARDEAVTLPSPQELGMTLPEGYEFHGWSNEDGEPITSVTIENDTTIYGSIGIIQCSLTYFVALPDLPEVIETYDYGTTVQLKSPEELGMTLPADMMWGGWVHLGETMTEITLTGDVVMEGQISPPRANLMRETRWLVGDQSTFELPKSQSILNVDSDLFSKRQNQNTTGITIGVTQAVNLPQSTPIVAGNQYVLSFVAHLEENNTGATFFYLGRDGLARIEKVIIGGTVCYEREEGSDPTDRLTPINVSQADSVLRTPQLVEVLFTIRPEITDRRLTTIQFARLTAGVESLYFFKLEDVTGLPVQEQRASPWIPHIDDVAIRMDMIPIGTDIRGWTFEVDTEAAPLPYDVLGSSGDGMITAMAVNDSETDDSLGLVNEGMGSNGRVTIAWNFAHIDDRILLAYGEWQIENGFRFTVQNDRPYLVTRNDLPAGDATMWGFRYIKRVE